MSCNSGVCTSQPKADAIGAPDLESGWQAARNGGQHHCPRCGGFLPAEGPCNSRRCTTVGDASGGYSGKNGKTTPESADSWAHFLETAGYDPLNNEAVRRMYSTYVSILTGKEREVVFDPTTPTGATDLQGRIYVNPYPLGKEGAVVDQMVINQGRVDHEYLHEALTPARMLEAVGEISRELSGPGRELVGMLYNIYEDARIETICAEREPFLWQRILAKHQLEPKDESARGGGLSKCEPYQQVAWGLQIDAQPNYHLTPDIRAGMSLEALETIKALRPVTEMAIYGNADDALAAAVQVARELERRGMLPESDPDLPGEMSVAPTHGGQEANGEIQATAPQPAAGGEAGEDEGESGAAGGSMGEAGEDEGESETAAGGHTEEAGERGAGQEKCAECGAFKSPDEPCENPKCPTHGDGETGPDPEAMGEASGASGSAGEEGDGREVAADSGDEEAVHPAHDGAEGDDGAEATTSAGGDTAGEEVDEEKAAASDGGEESDPAIASSGKNAPGDYSEVEIDEPGGAAAREGDADADFFDDEGAMERQAVMENEASAALSALRHETGIRYRSAIKTMLKKAGQDVAKKVAAGPEKNRPLVVNIPLKNYRNENRTDEVAINRLKPGQLRSEWSGGEQTQIILYQNNEVAIKRGGNRFAQRLKKVRAEVERSRFLQKRGQIDRRRMKSVLKGSDRIRFQPGSKRGRDMCATVEVDMSGSMGVSQDELGTVFGMIAKGLEGADIPYEARAYTGNQYQIKSFQERRIKPEQIAATYGAGGDNDDPYAVALGGIALQARKEETKMQFVITDGDPDCGRMTEEAETTRYGWDSSGFGAAEVAANVEQNRIQGQVVVGIFYAKPSKKSREDVATKFDAMYGEDGWAYIKELDEAPGVIADVIEAQIRKTEGKRKR